MLWYRMLQATVAGKFGKHAMLCPCKGAFRCTQRFGTKNPAYQLNLTTWWAIYQAEGGGGAMWMHDVLECWVAGNHVGSRPANPSKTVVAGL